MLLDCLLEYKNNKYTITIFYLQFDFFFLIEIFIIDVVYFIVHLLSINLKTKFKHNNDS